MRKVVPELQLGNVVDVQVLACYRSRAKANAAHPSQWYSLSDIVEDIGYIGSRPLRLLEPDGKFVSKALEYYINHIRILQPVLQHLYEKLSPEAKCQAVQVVKTATRNRLAPPTEGAAAASVTHCRSWEVDFHNTAPRSLRCNDCRKNLPLEFFSKNQRTSKVSAKTAKKGLRCRACTESGPRRKLREREQEYQDAMLTSMENDYMCCPGKFEMHWGAPASDFGFGWSAFDDDNGDYY